ncbi:YggL family protein [Undibacterium fentianense]|uniref:DUF469 family protein n=1 Tax=Undibacterium fentianense TaxID=2828728 RepID=A0A941E3Q0_9BURK|nr:YggL family protein [Undibacterium fentianense]MBR7800024.1 DUF469 family protein [Undibacterium fentianense]
MTPSKKSRNARQRKKLHVGEFQEFGFEYKADLIKELNSDEEAHLIHALLEEVIEPRDLALSGWLNGGFVCRFGSGSATDDDREALRAWMQSRAEFENIQVGALKDAWYSPMDTEFAE